MHVYSIMKLDLISNDASYIGHRKKTSKEKLFLIALHATYGIHYPTLTSITIVEYEEYIYSTEKYTYIYFDR